MEKLIEYYEFPNGKIVKNISSDGVYQYDSIRKEWEKDDGLTAIFSWDRPFGEPCANLRQKADLDGELPPFPGEKEFFPGNTVLIGAYPQKTPYDFSPIPWLILETTGETALCISRDCLITSGYCDANRIDGKQELPGWENSLAREICNGSFYDSAFSEKEKARIVPRRMSSVRFGTEWEDLVFLLSEKEVLRYFPTDSSRRALPTSYACGKGAVRLHYDGIEDSTCWWILPEEDVSGAIYPKAVLSTGEIQFHSRNIYHADFTLRPCIQIDYSSDYAAVDFLHIELFQNC